MIAGEIYFQIEAQGNKNILNDIKFRQIWLVIKSDEKNHPEHKYSITFITKVGTKKVSDKNFNFFFQGLAVSKDLICNSIKAFCLKLT